MAKSHAKQNHGQAVKAFVHEAQAARGEGVHPGIGEQVSEFTRSKGEPPPLDFEDGVITVVNAEGATQTFTTFGEALAFAGDGDTLQVGAGVYFEAIDLDERVTIIGEEGAVLDGSTVATDVATTSTVELFDGFSGGSISGLHIVAVEGGNAIASIIGEAVTGIGLANNQFDAGANSAGAVVYLNPGADGVVIEGNSFEGSALTGSPLLGIEGDNVTVEGNIFGAVAGPYVKVEVFQGTNGTTDDVILLATGNTGLTSDDIFYG